MKKIPLTRGKEALVDDEDYEKLSKFKWFCSKKGYAVRKAGDVGNKRIVFMHRELLNCPKEKFVDHINRNKLDNRKSNLRLATSSQNGANRDILSSNTSGYKGVSYSEKTGKWVAYIRENHKHKHLGYYLTKDDAAKAYNVEAERIYGEFAVLNDVNHHSFKIKVKKKTSKFKGVSFNNLRQKWYVHIRKDGKTINLGCFDSEIEAAKMYNFWMKDIYGANVKLNKITEAI